MTKLTQLAQMQLGRLLTRTDVQALIQDVIAELPRYWTLTDLTDDWRLNHLPRNMVQEAVDMLVVQGKVRPALIRRETGDPQAPIDHVPAFTLVTEKELVTPAEIRL